MKSLKRKYSFPLYNILNKLTVGDLLEILDKFIAYNYEHSNRNIHQNMSCFIKNFHPKLNKFLE